MRICFLVLLFFVGCVLSRKKWKKTLPKDIQPDPSFFLRSSTHGSGQQDPALNPLLGRSPRRGERFKIPDFDSKKYPDVMDTRPLLTNPGWVYSSASTLKKPIVNRKDVDLKNVVLWLWKRLEGREFVSTDPDVQFFLEWCTNHFKLEKPYKYDSGRTTFTEVVKKLKDGTFQTGGASTSYNWPTFLDVFEDYVRSRTVVTSSIDGTVVQYTPEVQVIEAIENRHQIIIPESTMHVNLRPEKIKQFAIEARLLVNSNEQMMVEKFRGFLTLSDGLEQLDNFVARTVDFNRGDEVSADDVMFEMEMAGLVSSMIGFGRQPYTIGPKRDLLAQSNMIKETVLAASREMASKIFGLRNEDVVFNKDGFEISAGDLRSLLPSNKPTNNVIDYYFSILTKSAYYEDCYFLALDGFRTISDDGEFNSKFVGEGSFTGKKRFIVPVGRESYQFGFYIVDVAFSEANNLPETYKLFYLYSNTAPDQDTTRNEASQLIKAIDNQFVREDVAQISSSVKMVKVADYGYPDGLLKPETTNFFAMMYATLICLEPGVEIRDGKDVVEFDERASPTIRRQMMGVVASSDPSNADRLFGLVEVDPDTETPLFVAGKIAADHLPMISEKWVGEETPLTKRRETVAVNDVLEDNDVDVVPIEGPPTDVIPLPELPQEAPPGTHYLPTKRLDYGHEFFKKSAKFERSPNQIKKAWDDANTFTEKFDILISLQLIDHTKDTLDLMLQRQPNKKSSDEIMELFNKNELNENELVENGIEDIKNVFDEVYKKYTKARQTNNYCYAASQELSRLFYYLPYADHQQKIFGPLLLSFIDRDGSRFRANEQIRGEGFRELIKRGWMETYNKLMKNRDFDVIGFSNAYDYFNMMWSGRGDLEARTTKFGETFYDFITQLLPKRFDSSITEDSTLYPASIDQPIINVQNGRWDVPDGLSNQDLIHRLIADSITRMLNTKIGRNMVIMKADGKIHRFNSIETYARVLTMLSHIYLHPNDYTYTRTYGYQHNQLYWQYTERDSAVMNDLNLVCEITGRTARQLKMLSTTKSEVLGNVGITFTNVGNVQKRKEFDQVNVPEMLEPYINPMWRPDFSPTATPPNPIIIVESRAFLTMVGDKLLEAFPNGMFYASAGNPDTEFRTWVSTLQTQFPEAKFVVVGDYNVGGISIGMRWKSGTDLAFDARRVARTGQFTGLKKMKFMGPNKKLMGATRWNSDMFLKDYTDSKLKQMQTILDKYAFKNDEISAMARELLDDEEKGGRRNVEAEQMNDEEIQKMIEEIRKFSNE